MAFSSKAVLPKMCFIMERDATQTRLTENIYLNGRKLQLNRLLILYVSYMLTKWSKKIHISVYFTKRAIISGFHRRWSS